MNNQQESYPQSHNISLLGIRDLLKNTWQVYKTRLGVFLGIMIPPLIVPLLFWIFPVAYSILSIFLFLALILNIIIVGPWSQAALIFAIKGREEKIGIIDSFRKGWDKIPSFLWVSILTTFIILGGFSLFIIPGLIFVIWFSLPLYVLVSEDIRGMNALFRSKQLISGNWGSIFWRFFVIALIASVVSFGIIFPITFLLNRNISGIIVLIISLFLAPFSVAYYFLIYEDLKRLKGDIAFTLPKRATKIGFISIGIIGLLLITGIVGGKTLYEQIFHKEPPIKFLKTTEAENYMIKAEEEMNKAKIAAEAGEKQFKIMNAINYANEATRLEPYNSDLWFRRGNIYFEVKDLVQGAGDWALRSYKKALELDPGNQLYRQKVEEFTK